MEVAVQGQRRAVGVAVLGFHSTTYGVILGWVFSPVTRAGEEQILPCVSHQRSLDADAEAHALPQRL